jgi:REP element-mobilizing transposase RayT
MARPLRLEFEGALYHLTARGNRRALIFLDDADCERFLALLALGLKRFEVELHGFVLMRNHFHLVALTRHPNLSRWMHWLLVSYAVYFQRRHNRVGEGHIFQGRFRAILIEAEGYLLSLSRYIHLNPVRGGRLSHGELAQRRARLRAWRWSSYPGYAGIATAHDFVTQERVLGEMSRSLPARSSMAECRRCYRRFVEQGLTSVDASPWEMLQAQTILGTEGFVQKIKDRLAERHERLLGRNEITAVRRLTPRLHVDESSNAPITADAVIATVAVRYGVEAAYLKAARSERGWSEARGVAMALLWELCRLNYRQIGELFEGQGYAAVAQRIRRIVQRNRLKKLRYSLATLAAACRKNVKMNRCDPKRLDARLQD